MLYMYSLHSAYHSYCMRCSMREAKSLTPTCHSRRTNLGTARQRSSESTQPNMMPSKNQLSIDSFVCIQTIVTTITSNNITPHVTYIEREMDVFLCHTVGSHCEELRGLRLRVFAASCCFRAELMSHCTSDRLEDFLQRQLSVRLR